MNHQSGSDFRLAADDFLIDPNTKEVFTVLDPTTGSNWVAAWPIFGLDNVQKSAFKTNSFYVNDRWQLDDKWSFNIGVSLRRERRQGRRWQLGLRRLEDQPAAGAQLRCQG